MLLKSQCVPGPAEGVENLRTFLTYLEKAIYAKRAQVKKARAMGRTKNLMVTVRQAHTELKKNLVMTVRQAHTKLKKHEGQVAKCKSKYILSKLE